MTVSIVLVSHSAALARGLAELAGQMAPDVTLVPAGGLPDRGLGSALDEVTAVLRGLRDAWEQGCVHAPVAVGA
jgi:PTS hybrid protein